MDLESVIRMWQSIASCYKIIATACTIRTESRLLVTLNSEITNIRWSSDHGYLAKKKKSRLNLKWSKMLAYFLLYECKITNSTNTCVLLRIKEIRRRDTLKRSFFRHSQCMWEYLLSKLISTCNDKESHTKMLLRSPACNYFKSTFSK